MNPPPQRVTRDHLGLGMRWMNVILLVSLLLALVAMTLDLAWPMIKLYHLAFHFLFTGLICQFVHNHLAAKDRRNRADSLASSQPDAAR